MWINVVIVDYPARTVVKVSELAGITVGKNVHDPSITSRMHAHDSLLIIDGGGEDRVAVVYQLERAATDLHRHHPILPSPHVSQASQAPQ
jgi:hypothetical protein